MTINLSIVAGLAVTLLGCSSEKKATASTPPVAAASAAAGPGANDAPPPSGSPAAARAANSAGMKSYRKRGYAEAAQNFRLAVALDPNLAVAHYNLACVTSLLGDRDAALAELRWLAASTDPVAAEKLSKAASDNDLHNVRSIPEAEQIVRWGAFSGYRPLIAESDESDADRRRFRDVTDEHDDCEYDGFKTMRALKGELVPDKPGPETAMATLLDGIVLFSQKGDVIARGELFDDCVCSQSGMEALSAGQVVLDPEPEIVVHYTYGGRANWDEAIAVYKRRGDTLARIFDGTIYSYSHIGDDETEASGTVHLGEGVIYYRPAGKKSVRKLHWDPHDFKFE
jgi:hypothetical protein